MEPISEDLVRRAVAAERALLEINEIRNSIIGLQDEQHQGDARWDLG